MPFQTRQDRQQSAGFGSVQRLKKRAAESAVINHELAEEPGDLRRAVNAPAPAHSAQTVEILRVFASQQRLRDTVTALLPQVGLDGVATVMPDKARVGKRDLAAALEQAPTNVHVVARRAKLCVEPVGLIERPFPESHIAAGDVLRVPVVKHHVRRTTRRNCDTAGDGTVLGWWKIVTANRTGIGLE